MSATDEAAREIELVARGYTVSTSAAALGRIGGDYMMRNREGGSFRATPTSGRRVAQS
jgi:hypothetical protein